MRLSAKHTKSKTVFDSLKRDIVSGNIKPGERLSPIRSIAKAFDTSTSVVQNAIERLEGERLLVTKDRSGVFVKEPGERAVSAGSQVFLCLPTEGHILGDFHKSIRTKLFKSGLFPITVDHSNFVYEPDMAFVGEAERLLEGDLKAAVVWGDSYWRRPFLERFPGIRSVFLAYMDCADAIPDRAALIDVEEGIYQMTSLLAAKGRRRIALCTFRPDPRSLSPETVSRHHSTQTVSGYDRALKERGLFSFRQVLLRTDAGFDAGLSALLESEDRPDAIVCDMDFEALKVMKAAIGLGLTVPGDLAISGFMDTPWAESAPVPLSSVRYDWDAIAEKAVELVVQDAPAQKVNWFKPDVMERAST